LPIQLDEINPHCQRLSVCEEEVEDDFSVMEEIVGIQERLKKVPYKMKLHIKEVMHQLAFLEDTMLSPSPRKVVTKGAKKRVRSTPTESSMGRIPSMWSMLILNFSIGNCHILRHHSKEKKCTY